MSLIGNILKRGIGVIAAAEDATVEYLVGSTWTAIPGSVMHVRQGMPQYDDEQQREIFMAEALLTMPFDGPDLATGTKVRFDSLVYTVRGPATLVNQKRYVCERIVAERIGPDRGATR